MFRRLKQTIQRCYFIYIDRFTTPFPPRRVWRFLPEERGGCYHLIDAEAGRIHASVYVEDGGKYYPSLFVSPFKAFKFIIDGEMPTIVVAWSWIWKVSLCAGRYRSDEAMRQEFALIESYL